MRISFILVMVLLYSQFSCGRRNKSSESNNRNNPVSFNPSISNKAGFLGDKFPFVDTANAVAFYSVEKIPKAVKKFFQRKTGYPFLMANPGEKWAGGCGAFQYEPRMQLIKGWLSPTYCKLLYRQGGYVLYNASMLFVLDGQRVTGFFPAN